MSSLGDHIARWQHHEQPRSWRTDFTTPNFQHPEDEEEE